MKKIASSGVIYIASLQPPCLPPSLTEQNQGLVTEAFVLLLQLQTRQIIAQAQPSLPPPLRPRPPAPPQPRAHAVSAVTGSDAWRRHLVTTLREHLLESSHSTAVKDQPCLALATPGGDKRSKWRRSGPYVFGDFHPSYLEEYADGLLFALLGEESVPVSVGRADADAS